MITLHSEVCDATQMLIINRLLQQILKTVQYFIYFSKQHRWQVFGVFVRIFICTTVNVTCRNTEYNLKNGFKLKKAQFRKELGLFYIVQLRQTCKRVQF